MTIRGPSIAFVKSRRAVIPHKHPQNRASKSSLEKVRPSGPNESRSDTAAPLLGIHIQRAEFALIRQIRVPRWHRGRKSLYPISVRRHDRPRLQRIAGREIIPLRPVFRSKVVEVFAGKEPPVSHLP